ncbi:PTS sugar transporter subunit IIA [Zophobihabitans entericus]|uniref:PTS sugar transporter subunit IIA n=1 Tax=Zophobihabitans entericus TaxID=1635327 RepID=A0A6G9ID88_9GAMM|nr:PTS sugar transporter subunit IIA [Zophobihabitans entericus]QIQ22201.1 PTS sugar transporter subunit IIA [Zophobihabitans entericus]
MIGVLLVSHGKMAEGMKDSVGMIAGAAEQFETLALVPGQDVNELKTNIFNKSKELNTGDGVLIFVDLFGASPYNASMRCVPEWQELGSKVRVITGMSLPMVVTAVCNREFSSLDELANDSVEAGKENIQDAMAVLAASSGSSDGDDY